MRILIFSPYFAPHVGGVESFVDELNGALLEHDEVERITVFAPSLPPGAPRREQVDRRYTIVRYPSFELIPNFPVPKLWSRCYWRALADAAPRQHDVIIGHTRFFVSSAVALVTARRTSRYFVHIEHGADYVHLGDGASRTAARAYDHTIGRWLLRRADAVIAVSDAAARFVARLAGRDAVVIYRGFWPHRLAAVTPDDEILSEASGRRVVTFIGRLIAGKGTADLVRAFAEVKAADVILCIVGAGPDQEQLKLLAEQVGISDRTRFIGAVSEQRALGCILASDVVVNPSYTEGLPTTVLEAALLGRAVLASNVGGTGEVVENNVSGILVGAGDLAHLTRELQRLIGNQALRERLGEAARETASQRFDWENSARRFLAVVSAVIARQPESRYQST